MNLQIRPPWISLISQPSEATAAPAAAGWSMRWRSMAAAAPAVAPRPILSPLGSSHLLHKPFPFALSLLRGPLSSAGRLSGLLSGSVGTHGSRASISASVSSPSSLNSPAFTSSSSSAHSLVLHESFLACSMPGRRLKVAVLVSGGVDSSVALRLLHAAGHACTAFYLKIWFQVSTSFV